MDGSKTFPQLFSLFLQLLWPKLILNVLSNRKESTDTLKEMLYLIFPKLWFLRCFRLWVDCSWLLCIHHWTTSAGEMMSDKKHRLTLETQPINSLWSSLTVTQPGPSSCMLLVLLPCWSPVWASMEPSRRTWWLWLWWAETVSVLSYSSDTVDIVK